MKTFQSIGQHMVNHTTIVFSRAQRHSHFSCLKIADEKICSIESALSFVSINRFLLSLSIALFKYASINIFQTQDLQRLANSNMTKVLNWEKERAYICFETSSNEDGEDVIKEIPLMSEEEFHCEDREVNSTTQSPDTGDGDDDDTKTIVSSVVGAILIVGLLVGIVASCYCKRSYGQRKFFYFRQNVTSSLDLRSDNQDDDDSHNEYEYDAFISFNEQDRPWVYTQLVPKLEPRKDPSDCTQETGNTNILFLFAF